MANAPVTYPLGPPSISGTQVTVDVLLNRPTVITRQIANIADQLFFADRIFSPGPDVEGGAILFELPPTTATDLFASTGVQEVAPGEEFPLMGFLRGVPVLAKPRKIGGKWFVTREARKRNDLRVVTRAMTQTANTIAATVDAMAMGVLAAAISANSRTYSGQSWATAATTTMTTRSGTNVPLSDLLGAANVVALESRGQVLDSIILHPTDNSNLARVYGPDGIDDALASVGINNRFVSPRATAGSPILFQEGQVGGWANEFPLTGEVADEDVADGGRQRTWYQWSVSPVMYVDNPYAFLQITGVS